MAITAPPELKYGYVVGRVVRTIADDIDSDELPDTVPSSGQITFKPVKSSGVTVNYPAIVLHEPIIATIYPETGEMYSSSGNLGVWLITGVYDVSFSLTSGSINSFQIEVKESHTKKNPLDLSLYRPIQPDPSTKFVVNEQVYINTLAASEKATSEADRAKNEADRSASNVVAKLTELKNSGELTGPRGPQGIQGPQGPQGIRGPQGLKGDTGSGLVILGTKSSTSDLPSSASPGDAYMIGTDLWVWPTTGGSFFNAGSIKGPKGDQGIQGIQGPKGDQGIQGIKGNTGSQGPTGPKGDTGSQGPKGDTGPQGLKGDTGPQGPTGATGSVSLTGVSPTITVGTDNVEVGGKRVYGERIVPVNLTRPLGARESIYSSRSVRIPFSVPTKTAKWRVVFRSINYRSNTSYTGAATFRSINVGTGKRDSNGILTSSFEVSDEFPSGFTTVASGISVSNIGDGWASDWMTTSLTPGVDYMLSYGFLTNGSAQPHHEGMGGGWRTDFAPNNATLMDDPTAYATDRQSFDVKIEIAVDESTFQDVVIGDSISASSNSTHPVFESPFQIADRQNGKVTRLHTFGGAAFGEWIGGAWGDPNSLKWQEVTSYGKAGRSYIMLGNNDIHGDMSLADLKSKLFSLIALLKERISNNVVVCTITPRVAWTGTSKEAIRTQFNEWLRSFPDGITGIADTARAVEDSTGHAPRADYVVEDGIHFNTMGSTALASAIASPFSPGNAGGNPLSAYLTARGV